MGETDGELPNAFLSEYNLNTHKWLSIITPSYEEGLSRSKSAVFMINDKLLVAGGIEGNYGTFKKIDILDVNTGKITRIGDLPNNTYYGASVFYKNKIYIHGGGYSFGWLPLRDIMLNDLIVIELNQDCDSIDSICLSDCSKGTYSKGSECYLCPVGSYSETVGSEPCIKCPSGYFSDIKGADSSRACKPCTGGYYNTEPGQARCLECPNGSKCTSEKVVPETESSSPSYLSVQPELFEYDSETVDTSSKYFDTSIAALFCISIISLLSFSKTRRFVRKLDLYSLRHNYGDENAMYIRKTLIGGIFSIMFISVALSIVFRMTLTYVFDNIIETKALVPLIAFQNQYESVMFT